MSDQIKLLIALRQKGLYVAARLVAAGSTNEALTAAEAGLVDVETRYAVEAN